MTEATSLLPQNATPWETAHELTDATRWAALDPSIITKVKDALQCDARFLGVLGWERSVDLWYDDWPEAKKRHVVDKWFEYERLKGTVEGFRRFYSLVGARLVSARLPPQGAYASPEWTDADRARYLAQFQQLRIYPRPVREFTDGFYPSHGTDENDTAFSGEIFPTAYNLALDGVIREARLYEPLTGEETSLTRREFTQEIVHTGTVYSFEEIVFPSRADGFFEGDHIDDACYLVPDDAGERTIKTEIQRPYGVALSQPQWTSVVPDARLISIYPDLIREAFEDTGAFLDHIHPGDFEEIYSSPDDAWQHIYERFHVYDRARDRGIDAGEPGMYADHAWLGMMPFTAELKVEIISKTDPTDFGEHEGFAAVDDLTLLHRTLDATRACKAARDTIYLDTVTRRTRRFGDRFTFGDRVRFGDTVEA